MMQVKEELQEEKQADSLLQLVEEKEQVEDDPPPNPAEDDDDAYWLVGPVEDDDDADWLIVLTNEEWAVSSSADVPPPHRRLMLRQPSSSASSSADVPPTQQCAASSSRPSLVDVQMEDLTEEESLELTEELTADAPPPVPEVDNPASSLADAAPPPVPKADKSASSLAGGDASWLMPLRSNAPAPTAQRPPMELRSKAGPTPPPPPMPVDPTPPPPPMPVDPVRPAKSRRNTVDLCDTPISRSCLWCADPQCGKPLRTGADACRWCAGQTGLPSHDTPAV